MAQRINDYSITWLLDYLTNISIAQAGSLVKDRCSFLRMTDFLISFANPQNSSTASRYAYFKIRGVNLGYRVFLKSRNQGKCFLRISGEETSRSRDRTKLLFREKNAEDQVIQTGRNLACLAFGHPSVVFP